MALVALYHHNGHHHEVRLLELFLPLHSSLSVELVGWIWNRLGSWKAQPSSPLVHFVADCVACLCAPIWLFSLHRSAKLAIWTLPRRSTSQDGLALT